MLFPLHLVAVAFAGARMPAAICHHRCAAPVAATLEAQHTLFARFNGAEWKGLATFVDPLTGEPGIPVAYDHVVVAQGDAAKRDSVVVRTSTTVGGEPQDDQVAWAGSTTDVDVDGSYSMQHPAGLGLATQLAAAATRADGTPLGVALDDALVLDCSLAVSDEERRRCLLAYDRTSRELTAALLLVETKAGAAAAPAGGATQATLIQLLGEWAGDASVRSRAPPPPPAKGFGRGLASRAADKPAAAARLNVFKARLSYGWDGRDTVARQLGVTGFDGQEAPPIRSVGTLLRHQGRWGEYEQVRFLADAACPSLLLLPSDCHVLAPLQLPEPSSGDAWSVEFGAVLPAGEVYGWQGWQGADDDDDESGNPNAASASSPRLVRIQRLHSADAFVSGTTSLCTAD